MKYRAWIWFSLLFLLVGCEGSLLDRAENLYIIHAEKGVFYKSESGDLQGTLVLRELDQSLIVVVSSKENKSINLKIEQFITDLGSSEALPEEGFVFFRASNKSRHDVPIEIKAMTYDKQLKELTLHIEFLDEEHVIETGELFHISLFLDESHYTHYLLAR
ncbi:MAG: hypothetical protein ACKVOH_03220 [Chlamydiales bacterium]